MLRRIVLARRSHGLVLPSHLWNGLRSLTTGETLFRKALEILAEGEEHHRATEELRSKQQYEAWSRSQEKAPKSGGVAVVKTIAKQQRQEREKEEEDAGRFVKEARKLLEEAAYKHGYPRAVVKLANEELESAKQEGNSQEEAKLRVKRAMDMYESANSAEGWFNLGNLLWMGYPDQQEQIVDKLSILLEKNERAAIEAFQKAIDLGDLDAMYFVGVQYLSAEDKNDLETTVATNRKGLELVTTAADKGHSGALYYLALLSLNGNALLGVDPSVEDYGRWLDLAAEAGDDEALFLRGHGYFHGEDGRVRSYGRALEDFLAAAEAGNADAAVSAGAMLHQGIGGVPQDQRRGFELYQLGGELGSTEGWRNVVACYAAGEGVPQSHKMARYIAKTMLKDE